MSYSVDGVSPNGLPGHYLDLCENQEIISSSGHLEHHDISREDWDQPKYRFKFKLRIAYNSEMTVEITCETHDIRADATKVLGHRFHLEREDSFRLKCHYDPTNHERHPQAEYSHPLTHLHISELPSDYRFPVPSDWDLIDFITFIDQQEIFKPFSDL